MRYLDEQAIENIAIGAAFLGTGGGGDPYRQDDGINCN